MPCRVDPVKGRAQMDNKGKTIAIAVTAAALSLAGCTSSRPPTDRVRKAGEGRYGRSGPS
jgi:hypothetical protein